MASATPSKSDKILEAIDEDLLCCSICLERYNKPKLLLCNHTYCEPCLAKLVNKTGRLDCPTCGAQFPIPAGGVKDLKGNFFIQSLIDIVQRRTAGTAPELCVGCEENVASHRCVDCCVNFCPTCTRPHRSTPITRGHKILTLTEYNDQASSSSLLLQNKVYCSAHPNNVVKFHCETCQVPVCSDCIVVKHRIPEHVHRDLQDAADEFAKQLAEMMSGFRIKEEEAKRCKTLARESRDKCNERYREEEERVKVKADETVRMVRREESRLAEELKTSYSVTLKAAEAHLDEAELKHGNISSTRSHIETLMDHGNPSQLLSSKQELLRRIGELATMEIRAPPSTDFITFHPSANRQEHGMLGSLGSEVSVPHCTIENITRQLWTGDSLNLIIRTRNGEGKQITIHQDIKAKIRRPDGSLQDIKVTDNRDGSHVVTVHGLMAGRHQVGVTIGNQQVPRSPFDISVKKGLVRSIGAYGSGRGQFNHPTGTTINRHGDLVTSDYGNGRVQIIGMDGNYKRSFSFPQFERPFMSTDVAISADDEYFMTDYGNSQIVVSDEDGRVLRCIRHPELKYPRGIAISPRDGSVYVTDCDGKGKDTDRSTHCVRKYTQQGQYIAGSGRYGTAPGEFYGPCFLAVNSEGMAVVPDVYNHRVQVFSVDLRQVLYLFGDFGSAPGSLHFPVCVITDADGHVYVSEEGNRRVQKFDSQGRFISCIAEAKDGIQLPVGLALTKDVPCKVAVVDCGNSCISVFAQ